MNKIRSDKIKSDKIRSPKTKNYEKHALVQPPKDDSRRCKYVDPNHGRCKMLLGRYPKYCQMHSITIDNLYVDQSHIKNAGYGLFAGVFGFKKGDVIGEYSMDSIRVKLRDIDQRSKNPDFRYTYCADPKRGQAEDDVDCWDALDYRSTIMRYANDAHNSKYTNNAYFENRKGRAYMIASKRIEPLEEIFVDYSEDYWATF